MLRSNKDRKEIKHAFSSLKGLRCSWRVCVCMSVRVCVCVHAHSRGCFCNDVTLLIADMFAALSWSVSTLHPPSVWRTAVEPQRLIGTLHYHKSYQLNEMERRTPDLVVSSAGLRGDTQSNLWVLLVFLLSKCTGTWAGWQRWQPAAMNNKKDSGQ